MMSSHQNSVVAQYFLAKVLDYLPNQAYFEAYSSF